MKPFASIVGVLLVVTLGGCSGTTADTGTEFWDAMSLEALEADQPASVDVLVSRSEIVVRGSIVGVEEGPINDPLYKDQNLPIAALVVRVDEVLAGEWQEKTVKVIVPRQPLVSVAEMRKSLSPEQVVMFVTDSGIEGYLATFSDLSIVTTVNGKVQTPLDPAASSVVIGKSRDLRSVADNIAVIAESSPN